LLAILSALIVAGAVVWAGQQLAAAFKTPVEAEPRATADLLALFAPAVAAAGDDPRVVLAWQPIAVTARSLYPQEFAALDRACGSTFPFSSDQIERAHARWTADWLTWERRHDAEFKLKAAIVEHELGDDVHSPFARARLDAVERDKLDLYQQRYEEYTRIAKGLQALIRR
jgi:hypothetical protein